ncbi:DUF3823 domain-containing protein [Echinicola vietnamensis]|uniref:DUF3823 domain-containing protein n=1 Tax=Echinicola vietnamensis (strain DSM 17526 / LMG 23754 / KMM 6221) TaxID=926556 RepID=L0FVX9_ECHVK|nr:DUF3823 domain-containing protein [Echinicola vietnamensis]AGA76825.1 hypothetical protein Echvi_0546 [Echinicola vietnamensis DSM 17526]
MKKIAYLILAGLFSLSSCSMFELDNYELPAETLQGEVVDIETGELVLTDQGSEGIRVRLTELSWGDNVSPNPDFFCMPDGTFQNTKLFAGNYNVRLDGPFIPLIREDERGVPLADETQTVDIKGVTNVTFEVQPFLRVEWVSEPEVINGKVRAQVRVTRGVSEEEFRAKIEPMGGYSASFQNVTDIQLFVSYSSTVGYRARDERWSSQLEFSGSSFNSMLGETITIESNGTIPEGRMVFVRAAARINFDTPRGSGTRRWNYNEPRQVLIY